MLIIILLLAPLIGSLILFREARIMMFYFIIFICCCVLIVELLAPAPIPNNIVSGEVRSGGGYELFIYDMEDNKQLLQIVNDSINTEIYLRNKVHSKRLEFPFRAENITYYKPFGEFSFKDEPDSTDIVFQYTCTDTVYRINKIHIPNFPFNPHLKCYYKLDKDTCKLYMNENFLHLSNFKTLLWQAEKLGFHQQNRQFYYNIYTQDKRLQFVITYKQFGKYLIIDFK